MPANPNTTATLELNAVDNTTPVIRRVTGATDGLRASYDKLGGSLTQMQGVALKATGVLGALGVTAAAAGMLKFVADTIKATAALDDMAEQTGATVENLSKLREVAKIGGHEFGGITDAIGKMIKGLKGADEEGQAAGKALGFLNVSAKDSNGRFRDSAEILQDVAKALAKYEDGGNKIALLQDLLGKSGAKYASLLKDMAEAGDTQAKVTSAQAAEAEKLEKNWNRLKIAGEDWKRGMVMTLTEGLNPLIERMLKAQKEGSLLAQILAESGKQMGRAGANVPFVPGMVMRGLGSMADAYENRRRPMSIRPSWKLGQSITEEFPDPTPPFTPIPLNYATETKKAAGATEDLDATYRGLLKTLKEKLLVDQELSEVNKLQLALDALSAKNRATITKQREAELKALASEFDLRKRRKDQMENEAKNEEALQKIRQEGADLIAEEDNKRIAAYASSQKTIEQIKFETTLIGLSNEAREEAIALRALEESGIKKTDAAYENEVRRLREALSLRQGAQRADEMRKRESEEWERLWGTVEQTGKSAFVHLLSEGRSSFESIGKALKASVIDVLYQLTARKWIIEIGTGIAGSLGISTAANATSGGGLMGGFNLASMGNTVSGWLGGPSLGSGGLASALGLGGASSAATSFSAMAGADIALGGLGGSAGAAALGGSAAGGFASLGALGPIGLAVGGALLVSSLLGKKGGPKQSELAIRGLDSGLLGLEPINVNGAGNIDARNPAYDQAAALLNQIPAGMRGGLVGKSVTTGPSDSAEAMVKALFDLQEVQAALKSAAESTEALAKAEEAAGALSQQRRQMDIMLMEAQGFAAEALAMRRADEKAAMDATLRPLADQIFAAQDLARANEEAARAQQAAADEAERAAAEAAQAAEELARAHQLVAQETERARIQAEQLAEQEAELARLYAVQVSARRRELEIELLEAQGNAEAALSARRTDALAALDESLRPLQQQIYATLDAARAADQARAAQEALTASYEKMRDALKTAQFSSLFEYTRGRALAGMGVEGTVSGGRYNVPGFASGGDFGGGMRLVGERGPEIEITGPSRIMSNQAISRMMDVTGVISEVRALRDDLRVGHIAIAQNTGKSARILDRWNGNGAPVRALDPAEPIEVSVVASVPVPVA